MIFQELYKRAALYPKRLFIVDGFGALLSAFMLGVVLVKYESIFGIPKDVLYVLAMLPCLFALFDIYSVVRIKRAIAKFLNSIAIMNLMYCVLSLVLCMYHFAQLTYLGWMYMLGEMMVVVVLASIELKVAKSL